MRQILLLFVLIFWSCAGARQHEVDYAAVPFAARPKNIILLIGDGMSLAQMSADLYWTGVRKSIFSQFKNVGFHTCHSFDYLVTDSAAGATAFSCGHKTTNGAIGVLPPDDQPCETILETLSKRGYATGMVVACTATHATPACFIAHRNLRAFTDEIALDYLKTPIDCVVAGGRSNFNRRFDKQNLIDSLKNKGYVVRTGTNFNRLPLDGSKPFYLFTDDHEPPTASGGRRYLPGATKMACNYLQKRSDKGFFLMVEGSQIDWSCHANDRDWLRAEMADFDRTVHQALNFAATNGETLVIVTGDHECGGLALTKGENRKDFKPAFALHLHTASWVPVYAYGPQAELFRGVYDNTDIYYKMRQAVGEE